MDAVELLGNVLDREKSEVEQIVKLSKTDPNVAEFLLMVGGDASSFRRGVLCALGAMETLGVDVSEGAKS